MPTPLPAHIAAANRLTARWCAAAGTGDFALSGCGVWPLLALLASAADEPGRSELATATGISAADGHDRALDLLRTLAEADSVSAALGLWVRRDLPLRPEWSRRLPAGTVETLTDQAALDAWASGHTDGLIEKFPLPIDAATALVLATALVARTRWEDPFRRTTMEVTDGPWRGHSGPALRRFSSRPQHASVLGAGTAVTRVIVYGAEDLDVHLLLGEGTPGTVLTTGLDALEGTIPIRTDLPAGTEAPGLRVQAVPDHEQGDSMETLLPPFEIRSLHNLIDQSALFGLTTVTDSARGHFPAMSARPLYVDQAAQDVFARFTETGFDAAAVTALSMNLGSARFPRPAHTVLHTTVTFDRPFGFLAVHRPTGLAVVAGWVAHPGR
ncbi:serpin family protein [Nocardia sp. NPDC059229]|uniref:serpin family protein n=1 Tax=Nocardia sp. NPDC059229 TaxID=3346778 RepID=UPI0036849945